MIAHSFFLQPFNPTTPRPQVTITGSVIRRRQLIALRYELRGPLTELVIPVPTGTPSRRPGLWEETCFEFFLAPRDSDRYWEFNLAPAGHWNVYRFQGYRRGMVEEAAFTTLPFECQNYRGVCCLDLEVIIEKIIPTGKALDIGISAVIKLNDGSRSYWALTHPGPQADFHHRDGFIINL